MKSEEQVMVVRRKIIEDIGMFQGLCFDTSKYLDTIFDHVFCLPRSEVEQDPSFKQIIPYVIMVYRKTFLSFIRGKKSGEFRLLGKRSIGIGGHINLTDLTYEIGVDREVNEEVFVETAANNCIVALLNDDSNEVGRVHFGIVHRWDLAMPNVTKREQLITDLRFMHPWELSVVRDTLEGWSQICFDNLSGIIK